jgi:hypothetical protein
MTAKLSITCESLGRKVLGEPAKREKDELYWLCPRHDDHRPSLKINQVKNIWMCGPCGAGGTWWALAAFLAELDADDRPALKRWLKEKGFELEGEKKTKPHAEILREHIYTLPDGTPIARKLRWGSHDAAQDKKLKSFSWQKWQNNAWIDGLSSQEQASLPFYRCNLPAEAGASAECPVVLTEGEHDADAGASLGLRTTTVGGTGAFRQHHADQLRQRHIVIIAHSDEQGRAEAEKRAALIFPVAASVRIVSLGEHKDLAEAIDKGLTRELAMALFQDAAPWHPATGAEILRRVRDKIEEYISLTPEQSLCVALWCAHTHAMAAFDYTPYLAITSAEMRCGKSHLLQVAGFLSARPKACASISGAALYRAIEKWQPTLLIDEADNLLKTGDETAEAIRGVLNCGYQRGLTAIRNVGQGANMEPAEFRTFGPKAFTGIGKALPGTIMDRALKIQLRRALPGEVKRFRPSIVERECQPIAAAVQAWIEPHIATLRGARPEPPHELDGRDADICEPLFAVADLAGERLPEEAGHALTLICTASWEDEQSLAVKLLDDIQRIFAAAKENAANEEDWQRIRSKDFCRELAEMEDRPWAEMPRTGKPITPAQLASILSRHSIKPRHLRISGKTERCYGYDQFTDVWERYLTSCPSVPGEESVPCD